MKITIGDEAKLVASYARTGLAHFCADRLPRRMRHVVRDADVVAFQQQVGWIIGNEFGLWAWLDWHLDQITIHFENEDDALLFAMKWL